MADFSKIDQSSKDEQRELFGEANEILQSKSANDRVKWALENLPGNKVLTSSFGIQSAVMLHLLTSEHPDIPVLVVDTGYLFPETYQFIDQLTERLKLNLHVYRAEMSPAWQEAKFGQLWLEGEEGIKKYNQINKVEPMQRAMKEHDVKTWFSGLRRSQSSTRADKGFVEIQGDRLKVLPIVDWDNREIYQYLKLNDLPYHPLWEQGYVSVGDTHTTKKLEAGMSEEETRFFGLSRECGLHVEEI